jgi:hypothetical protein
LDNHTLAERITGLASRVNNLAVLHTGTDSRKLFEQQNHLIDLAEYAIVSDLDADDPAYQAALKSVDAAIETIGEANKTVKNVSKAISAVATAITKVAKVVA